MIRLVAHDHQMITWRVLQLSQNARPIDIMNILGVPGMNYGHGNRDMKCRRGYDEYNEQHADHGYTSNQKTASRPAVPVPHSKNSHGLQHDGENGAGQRGRVMRRGQVNRQS